MASNLSTFPEQIDTFVRHYDVSNDDIERISRYQYLRTKNSLTPTENAEMSNLFSALRDKIWLAEDLNKIQDCMTNLETFFKYQTETYISDIFAQYDERMSGYANRVQNMEISVNNKITEVTNATNNAISDVTATRDDIVATIYDSQYFNFDNMSYRNGFARKIEKRSETVTVETIYNATNNEVYATRTTTKNGTADYTVVTVCDKVVPAVSITVHTYKDESDNWVENVLNN